nr:carbohydrate ABC transporter permease [Actinomycetota bacterium]
MTVPGNPLESRSRSRRPPITVAALRFAAKAPLNVLLIAVALLWLIPTVGLFLTSLLSPIEIGQGGWWRVLSRPALMTVENYRDILANEAI